MKSALLALLCLGLAAPACAYRKPRNYRRKKKVEVSASSSTIVGLPPGRWAPGVRAALLKFATERGAGSPGYDASKPPLAALPFNDFAVEGDPGEELFTRIVRRGAFRFSEDFWKQVPIAYGRQRLRAAYEQFSALPEGVWERQPTYHQYFKGFVKSYQDMCVKVDVKDCRVYLARLLIGFPEADIAKYAEETVKEEREREPGLEDVPEAAGDARPAKIRHGLREIPEARALVEFLKANGVEVWFLEMDARQALNAAAAGWPVPPERQLAIRQGLFRERFDGKPFEPLPIRGGKVDALVEAAGRPADLVVGVSVGDVELLSYGTGVRVAVDRGDGKLLEAARKKGWLVQPGFF